jgi:urease accessory protein
MRAAATIITTMTELPLPLGEGRDGGLGAREPGLEANGFPSPNPLLEGEGFSGYLVKLLTWLSPAFPTGAFAYSHGLEWAVEAGDVSSEAALLPWLEDVLRHGSGHTDAVLLRHAHRARNLAALMDVAEMAQAAQPSRERREETLGQGGAFAIAARVWGARLLEALPGPVAYPVAVGALARAHGVPEDAAALGLLHAFAANLVGAAVRLVPLGQTAGLRVMVALEPTLHAVAAATRETELDGIGGACFRSDIASMRHETQYTRLFRT